MDARQPSAADPDVTGVVLAGGRSSRFGDADANKAVASLGGRTLLGRVVDSLADATDRSPVVAVRTAAQRETYAAALSDRSVAFARDDAGFDGPLAGVYGAADAVDAPWLFCCGCDMPLLSPAVVRWLVEALRDRVRARSGASDASPAALAVCHPDGTPEPLHALYRTSAVERVRNRLPSSAGPRALLESLEPVVTVPVDAAPAGLPVEESTTNVNTRDELAAAAPRPPPTR
jgi:molybdopterin-guanine dinucleotide biosynthesis protein A